jgi:pyruvate dehydrogenase E1 component
LTFFPFWERRKGFNMTDVQHIQDQDPEETREWLDAIESVIRAGGAERAHFLLERLIDQTRRSGAYLPFKPNISR